MKTTQRQRNEKQFQCIFNFETWRCCFVVIFLIWTILGRQGLKGLKLLLLTKYSFICFIVQQRKYSSDKTVMITLLNMKMGIKKDLQKFGPIGNYIPMCDKYFAEFKSSRDCDSFGIHYSYADRNDLRVLTRLADPKCDISDLAPPPSESLSGWPEYFGELSRTLMPKDNKLPPGTHGPFWITMNTRSFAFATESPWFGIPDFETLQRKHDNGEAFHGVSGTTIMLTNLPARGFIHEDVTRLVWTYLQKNNLQSFYYDIVILPLQRRAFVNLCSEKCADFAEDYFYDGLSLKETVIHAHIIENKKLFHFSSEEEMFVTFMRISNICAPLMKGLESRLFFVFIYNFSVELVRLILEVVTRDVAIRGFLPLSNRICIEAVHSDGVSEVKKVFSKFIPQNQEQYGLWQNVLSVQTTAELRKRVEKAGNDSLSLRIPADPSSASDPLYHINLGREPSEEQFDSLIHLVKSSKTQEKKEGSIQETDRKKSSTGSKLGENVKVPGKEEGSFQQIQEKKQDKQTDSKTVSEDNEPKIENIRAAKDAQIEGTEDKHKEHVTISISSAHVDEQESAMNAQNQGKCLSDLTEAEQKDMLCFWKRRTQEPKKQPIQRKRKRNKKKQEVKTNIILVSPSRRRKKQKKRKNSSNAVKELPKVAQEVEMDLVEEDPIQSPKGRLDGQTKQPIRFILKKETASQSGKEVQTPGTDEGNVQKLQDDEERARETIENMETGEVLPEDAQMEVQLLNDQASNEAMDMTSTSEAEKTQRETAKENTATLVKEGKPERSAETELFQVNVQEVEKKLKIPEVVEKDPIPSTKGQKTVSKSGEKVQTLENEERIIQEVQNEKVSMEVSEDNGPSTSGSSIIERESSDKTALEIKPLIDQASNKAMKAKKTKREAAREITVTENASSLVKEQEKPEQSAKDSPKVEAQEVVEKDFEMSEVVEEDPTAPPKGRKDQKRKKAQQTSLKSGETVNETLPKDAHIQGTKSKRSVSNSTVDEQQLPDKSCKTEIKIANQVTKSDIQMKKKEDEKTMNRNEQELTVDNGDVRHLKQEMADNSEVKGDKLDLNLKRSKIADQDEEKEAELKLKKEDRKEENVPEPFPQEQLNQTENLESSEEAVKEEAIVKTGRQESEKSTSTEQKLDEVPEAINEAEEPEKETLKCRSRGKRKGRKTPGRKRGKMTQQREVQDEDQTEPEEGEPEPRSRAENSEPSVELREETDSKVESKQSSDVEAPKSKRSRSQSPPVLSNSKLPPFKPNNPLGLEHMVFYCKLCEEFCADETTARDEHCCSRRHYDNLKKYLEKQEDTAQF